MIFDVLIKPKATLRTQTQWIQRQYPQLVVVTGTMSKKEFHVNCFKSVERYYALDDIPHKRGEYQFKHD